MGFEGGQKYKMYMYGFKGGPGKKILGVKGGGVDKRILSSFAVSASVIMGS